MTLALPVALGLGGVSSPGPFADAFAAELTTLSAEKVALEGLLGLAGMCQENVFDGLTLSKRTASRRTAPPASSTASRSGR